MTCLYATIFASVFLLQSAATQPVLSLATSTIGGTSTSLACVSARALVLLTLELMLVSLTLLVVVVDDDEATGDTQINMSTVTIRGAIPLVVI